MTPRPDCVEGTVPSTPSTLPLPVPCRTDAPVILGIGGEMKNRFCLLKQGQAFFSPYTGAIDSLEGEEFLLAGLRHMQKRLGVNPAIVAYDAHPDYASARVARQLAARAYVPVQHHHAHLAACLAENGLANETVIGVLLDGSGYGTDGHLWGFEIFTGSYAGFQRRYHLAYVPLPGGAAAVRQPWRTAVAYLATFLGAAGKAYARTFFPGKNKELDVIARMAATGFNSPLSSGCGRLFDAVSALLGLCRENTCEGQAAMALAKAAAEADAAAGADTQILSRPGGNRTCDVADAETAAAAKADAGVTAKAAVAGAVTAVAAAAETAAADRMLRPYPCAIGEGLIQPGGIIAGVIQDRLAGVPVALIAARFHQTLAHVIVHVVELVAAATGLKKVALSGGTWQNQYLFRTVKEFLRARGYQVLAHRQVPANDSGIALGQAMVAQWRWR